jgi:uncharacterized integral membrane protein
VQLVWIASLFFALLIALFAVQNTMPVTVTLLAWRLEGVAVSLVVLAAAALGALLTYLFGLGRELRSRMSLRGHRSTVRDQDALIEELRARVRELERENEQYRAAQQATEPRAAVPESAGQPPPTE